MRVSPHLMIYFLNGRVVLENYITGETFQGVPDTLLLLELFKKWRTVREATRGLADYREESIIGSMQNLVKNGLLITKDSEQDRFARKFSKDWIWPIPARHYHFATRLRAPYSTSSEVREFYEKNLKGKNQPSMYKNYPTSPKVRLPPFSGIEAPLFGTMRRRHTTRSFSRTGISMKQLSRIIYFTWGRVSTYKTREFGPLLHKASPSAGARHPIEAYAVVNNVRGLERGIYHYSVKGHALELLRSGDFREKCVDFAAGQSWTRDASVLFIMTAVVSRTAWKYRIPRVYRAFFLDAGHLSQSFLLASTALGLGAFCIGIIGDIAIERELGLDGVNEVALFVVGVGPPSKGKVQRGASHD